MSIPPNYPGATLRLEGTIKAHVTVTRVTMTGHAILTDTDTIYEMLDPNGSDRDVTLPTPTNGMAFVLKHIGVANTLTVKDAGGSAITGGTLTTGEVKTYLYDGTAWQVL